MERPYPKQVELCRKILIRAKSEESTALQNEQRNNLPDFSGGRSYKTVGSNPVRFKVFVRCSVVVVQNLTCIVIVCACIGESKSLKIFSKKIAKKNREKKSRKKNSQLLAFWNLQFAEKRQF
jgi:predicted aminopeptidase